MTKSEFRIDLDGNQGEKVEQEHIDHAQKALEESRAKIAKRKKQQRPRQDSDSKSFKKKPAHASKPGDKNAPAANKPAKAAPAKRSGKIEPLPATEVKVNNKVKVKLGQALAYLLLTQHEHHLCSLQLLLHLQVLGQV